MKTFLSFPPEIHNTLEEKILEERVEQTFNTHTVCGRLWHDVSTFDMICDCDAVVLLHGRITPEIVWVVKIAMTLKKKLYVYDASKNTFTLITEVRLK